MIGTASPARPTTELLYGETVELPERLQPCERLFEMVALRPGAAATQNRLEEVSLAPERALAALETCGAKPGTDAVRAPAEATSESRLLQRALDVLDGCSDEEQRLRGRIGALQDAALPVLRSLPVSPRHVARAG